MQRNEYDTQAELFLSKFGLELRSAFKGDRCPAWDDDKHIHGNRYRVTIRRKAERRSVSFDFWDSYTDARDGKTTLRPYNVLSSVSSEAHMPTNPDEVVEELGEMRPSQAIAAAKFAAKLQAFFTEEEMESLAEIQ